MVEDVTTYSTVMGNKTSVFLSSFCSKVKEESIASS